MISCPIYIPDRFRDTVSAHLVMNVINIPKLKTPLILGIHGPAGEGKTEQCRYIFEEMGVKAEWLFADMFESEQAGEPVKLVKKKYKTISEFNLEVKAEYKRNGKSNKKSKLAILFINDIDWRIGRSDALIQQTINTQHINTALMEIADAPDELDGVETTRVPIVLTGNNLEVLYSPLRRDGRMEKFEWVPTLEEKAAIIRQIFPETSLTDDAIHSLVKEFGMHKVRETFEQEGVVLPTSSFATIRFRLYKGQIIEMIHNIGISQVLDYVLRGEHTKHLRHPRITLESVRSMAHDLIQDGLLTNHLRS